jgi:hypothetical protein
VLEGIYRRSVRPLDRTYTCKRTSFLAFEVNWGPGLSTFGVSTVWGHVQSLTEESDIIIEATSVARMATQIDTSVRHALETVVMGKIHPTVKPSFLFAKRYTTGVNGTPGDVLEAPLHALEMGTGGGTFLSQRASSIWSYQGAEIRFKWMKSYGA